MVHAEAVTANGSDVPDDALVAAALADRARFAAIYERHRLPVYRYVRARGADEDTAIDIVAIAFERALVALPTYRPRGGGLGAWLFRIARNAWLDEGRRRARTAGLSLVADHTDGGGLGRDPDLHLALRRLPTDAQEAVALRYAAGLTAAEIGQVLGKRPAAVQKLIERSLDTLKEALDVR
ncbi:MAG: sigma-70 family RNA polymerase sigma factor [Chloroflexota bacterium]